MSFPALETAIPSEVLAKWQRIVDLLADIMHVPSAVVTKLEHPHCAYYTTVVANSSELNPFPVDQTFSMDIGTFCETVIKKREPLLVANGIEEAQWNSAPEIAVGMVSYLGFPVSWPDGRIFGTICVLDGKTNAYSDAYQEFLRQCRDVLEVDLQTLVGHLGIQFAHKFGYRVAAIGRGSANAALAKELGAAVYIDSKATNAAAELKALGGARVVLATAPNAKSMSELIDGLAPNGKLMVIGADLNPIEVTPIQLIFGTRCVEGWASGTPADAEDTLRFAELSGVRAMIETYPLERAGEAYDRMLSGDARFRVVLTM